MTDLAAAADEFDVAEKAATAAIALARKLKDVQLVARWEEKKRGAAEVEIRLAKVKKAGGRMVAERAPTL